MSTYDAVDAALKAMGLEGLGSQGGGAGQNVNTGTRYGDQTTVNISYGSDSDYVAGHKIDTVYGDMNDYR
ncbi:hypothetical protein [Kitasatospora sp. HPMI-4]|uniref:hypothetical protein n=1 Tax=Kitasatospora sp. HPMI-4 TaxID=3448443 RepID=UPI003F19523F